MQVNLDRVDQYKLVLTLTYSEIDILADHLDTLMSTAKFFPYDVTDIYNKLMEVVKE